MNAAISQIDRKIDGIRTEVCRRTLLMNIFSSESWQRAWDRHPELRARQNELFRQRGIAQQERDATEQAKLPPMPWDWTASAVTSANGSFHAYLVDATGRKIAAIWGKAGEKEKIADRILVACNAYDALIDALTELYSACREVQEARGRDAVDAAINRQIAAEKAAYPLLAQARGQ